VSITKQQTTSEPARRRGFWTRETRLLLITVAVSVAVLFVLARFRFPDQEPLELPTQPLQRLAARAAFDDLSAAVARASERVRPALRVVEVPSPADQPRSVSLEDVLWMEPGQSAPRLALAYRFKTDAAIVVSQPRAWSAAGPVRPAVVATDDVRGLVVLDASEDASDGWQALSVASLASPQYLLIAEATYGGVALRPLFGGTADSFADPLWDQPLVALGQDMRTAHGALVFSLEGAFAGAVMERHGAHAVVPADLLIRAADRLSPGGRRRAATIGVRLQRLDLALRGATGASAGALVSDVTPGGPAATALTPGDVIIAVGGRRVDTPDAALLAIARLAIDAPASLEVRRNRARVVVNVTPVPLADPPASPPRDDLGVVLRRLPAGTRVDSVVNGGAAEVAGVREGDIITWVDGTDDPTPQRVTAAWSSLAPRETTLLRVNRGGEPLMFALRRP
jgi:hypothetical protein